MSASRPDRPLIEARTSRRRWVLVLTASVSLLLLTAYLISRWRRAGHPGEDPPTPIGLWRLPADDEDVEQGGLPFFRYDGETIHIHRPRWRTLFSPFRIPEDHIFRLKARWEGDVLYYLDHQVRWRKVGTFVDGHFQVRRGGVPVALAKVRPGELTEREQVLLQDRPTWDYSGPLWRRRPFCLTLVWSTELEAEDTGPVAPALTLREDPEGVFPARGYPERIDDLAYSPDGKRLVSAGSIWDPKREVLLGYAKLWDATTGKEEGTLERLPGPVRKVAFSPDGLRVAVACEVGPVTVWDVKARRRLLSLSGHAGKVSAVAFSPDGLRLASCGEDGTVLVWDAGGTRRRVLTGHNHPVRHVSFAPGNKRLLSVDGENEVRVWDLASGTEHRRFRGPTGAGPVAFHPDGRRVAFGSSGRLKVWDVLTGKPRGRFSSIQGHAHGRRAYGFQARGEVENLAFSADGKYLVSAGDEWTVKLWDADSGRKLFTIDGYRGPVTAFAFSPDGTRLASCVRPETIEVWDLADLLSKRRDRDRKAPAGRIILSQHADGSQVWALAVSPDGKMVASAGVDETIRLWDVPARKPLRVLRGHIETICCLAFSADGKTLASASTDGEVKLWDAGTWKEMKTLTAHTGEVETLGYTPDGKALLLQDADGGIKLWDLGAGRVRLTLADRVGAVKRWSFAAGGRVFVTVAAPRPRPGGKASAHSEVVVWDATLGKPLYRFPAPKFFRLALTADGRTLAVAGQDDPAIKLWDVSARKERATLSGHTDWVDPFAFAPDGTLLASPSLDSTGEEDFIQLWHVPSGKSVARISTPGWGVGGRASVLAFTPDGNTLIAGSMDGKVHFWDLKALRKRLPRP